MGRSEKSPTTDLSTLLNDHRRQTLSPSEGTSGHLGRQPNTRSKDCSSSQPSRRRVASCEDPSFKPIKEEGLASAVSQCHIAPSRRRWRLWRGMRTPTSGSTDLSTPSRVALSDDRAPTKGRNRPCEGSAWIDMAFIDARPEMSSISLCFIDKPFCFTWSAGSSMG